jgi:hypothetical protein
MALAEDYVAALTALSRVFEVYRRITGHYPVLVGGAAAAIYTDGLFPSGDFDVVAPSDGAFDTAMLAEGFVGENRVGKLKIGFYHPDHSNFGYQQVTGPLFEGRTDYGRLVRITTDAGHAVILPPIEDMIADRLGQHAVASPTDVSRLRQAEALFKLSAELDLSYLIQRII